MVKWVKGYWNGLDRKTKGTIKLVGLTCLGLLLLAMFIQMSVCFWLWTENARALLAFLWATATLVILVGRS